MKKVKNNQIGIHLDVGHDSIGWCVTDRGDGTVGSLRFLGSGVVLFPADDCLANHRRAFRRQRRHIRATRQRIARMRALFLQRGVLTEAELDANPIAFPWKLAAAVLCGERKLSWPELWCVLRWYAHNRGYDGNVLCSLRSGRQVDQEDIKKNAAARKLMQDFGTGSMAETMCRYLEIDPNGKVASSMKRFKELGVSFDRTVVVDEVRRILERHIGVLKGLDVDLIHLLLADPATEQNFLRSRTDLPFRIQARFWGGILFGQLAPRFDNRIIGTCPVSGGKLPNKAAKEFLDYRWAMMLANTLVGDGRRLTAGEIGKMNEDVAKKGGYTKGSYKKLIEEVTGEANSNVDALLTAPEADKSLVRYPGIYAISKWGVAELFEEKALRKAANKLYRGKVLALRDLRGLVDESRRGAFDEAVNPAKQRGKKKQMTLDEILEQPVAADLQTGRAPYAREVLAKAAATVFAGKDPRESGGILYRDATKADPLPAEKIDEATNNHLVRHRVKIMLRLLDDIVHDYAENNRARIANVTIETARDIKDLSGKTNKEIVSEMLSKTEQHRKVAKKLADFLHCDVAHVSAGLIRKARIAEDLGYTCPYTGFKYDLQDVVSKHVDLDHILPRSQRESDSLDSLVLTFTEVNRMKGARTGLEFVREFGGQRVKGRENLVVHSEAKYRQFAEALKTAGHGDDRKRQLRRREKLLKLHADESGFTEGALTRTSYITSLASKAIYGFFAQCGRRPRVVSVPGRVTSEFRKQWKILGILAKVDPRVLDENGDLRLKSEIRGITHMHHAVDAITLGLAATLLPTDGALWSTMCKRRVTSNEGEALKALGCFNISAKGEPQLVDLPQVLRDTIAEALAEQRVVVHESKEKVGLKVQQLTWGVEKVEGDTVHIRQRARDPKTGKLTMKRDQIPMAKAFGVNPIGGDGKLKRIKGVLLPDVNYGVALTNPPQVIRFNRVWQTLASLGGGRMPPIVRRGGLISVKSGSYQGIWRVASVKDVAGGTVMLDILSPYATKVANKVTYAKINVSLSTLMNNGLEVLKPRYTGVPICPTTSLTSQARGSSSR